MINVTAIKLPEAFDVYKNSEGEKLEFIEPLSKINIFVGSNNSGKSRFMRNIAKQSNQIVKTDVVQEAKDKIEVIKGNINRIFGGSISFDGTIIKSELEKTVSNFTGVTQIGTDISSAIRSLFFDWLGRREISSTQSGSGQYYDIPFGNRVSMKNNLDVECRNAIKILDETANVFNEFKFNGVYIPVLRGLRPLDNPNTDFYAERTEKDYFSSEINTPKDNQAAKDSAPEIFTGLSLYNRIHELKNGEYTQRNLILKYEKFITQSLFENQSVELIAKPKFGIVFVKIVNEREQPIHHLGDGIQSAIILTFLPFVMQEQTFFFIEEPEMFLHPGLQRKILEFYSSLERHTFFMTTHSNHFLDITIDIKDVSIFTFRKLLAESKEDELTPNFTIEAVDSGHESSLELLGVRNSSVFLVNATIWVEGITDRWYLRQMLESYMDSLGKDLKLRLEEDVHYSFVEYGGANITHWSFLDCEDKPIGVENLCARAMVIIDGDGDSKKERKEKLRERLKENLIILPCREIENALPYAVIKEVVLECEKDANLNIKDYSFNDYKDEYLGEFIETKMLDNNAKRKGAYRNKPQQGKTISGTIKDKRGFCEKAKDKIKFENLDASIQAEIVKIYEFIYRQNT